MITTAVILAAGRGSRLAPSGRSETYSKPLISVAGTTLLERTIAGCREAGARRILVVTGFRADRVAACAEAASRGDIEVVYNAEWQRANGLSLLGLPQVRDRSVRADDVRSPVRLEHPG